MKRLFALAITATLTAGVASAYDAATCTTKLTGTWKIALEGASMTLDMATGGAITVTVVVGGQPPESSKGAWSAEAGAKADQCKLKTIEEGAQPGSGDESVVTIKDDKTIEIAEMGVFTRQ